MQRCSNCAYYLSLKKCFLPDSSVVFEDQTMLDLGLLLSALAVK